MGDSTSFVSPLWIPKLCTELRELSKKRAIIRMADIITKESKDKTSDQLVVNAMNILTHITQATEKNKTDIQTITKSTLKHWEEVKDKDIIGISCGFKALDESVSGMQGGHVWVLGGYTNYGKTTLAISILSHLIRTCDEGLLYCSLEMSQRQILEKIISNFTRKQSGWNRRNTQESIVKEALAQVTFSKLHITDELNSVEEIGLKIQEMIINGEKPSVVFIDFIQNVQGKGHSEYERITNAILQVQAMARRLNVCIVVLSQVNNQSSGISEVMGFKSSGAIASAADLTVQIIREKSKEMESARDGVGTELVKMGLLIQKSRHGRGGYIDLEFDTTKGLIVGH